MKEKIDWNKAVMREKTDADGKKHLTGEFEWKHMKFRFSLTEQKTTEYDQKTGEPIVKQFWRGRVTPISAKDGFALHCSGKKKSVIAKKAKESGKPIETEHDERTQVFAQIRCAIIEKALRDKLQAVAEALFFEWEETYFDAAQFSNHKLELQTPGMALKLKQDAFLKSCPTMARETLQKKKNALFQVFSQIEAETIADITPAQIAKLSKKLGKEADRKLGIAKAFYAFCLKKRFLNGENPFEIYLDTPNSNRKQKKLLAAAKQRLSQSALSESVEKRLLQQVFDGELTADKVALILISQAGLTPTEALSLCWKDINFPDDQYDFARIRIFKPEVAGAVHDYTRPCFPLVHAVLSKWHAMHMASQSAAKEKRGLVLVNRNGKAMDRRHLTEICRSTLVRVGVTKDQFSTESRKEGKGVQLLLSNYKYRLEHMCGLLADPAAVRYMQAKSLGYDTTAQYYRSFSGPDGQRYLYRALRRDPRFYELMPPELMPPEQRSGNRRMITLSGQVTGPKTLEIVSDASFSVVIETIDRLDE